MQEFTQYSESETIIILLVLSSSLLIKLLFFFCSFCMCFIVSLYFIIKSKAYLIANNSHLLFVESYSLCNILLQSSPKYIANLVIFFELLIPIFFSLPSVNI